MRKIIALAVLALALSAIKQQAGAVGTPSFGKLGVVPDVPATGGGGGCSPTGAIFNAPCNSMYATVIHF
jgi:hypothetical protein